MRSHPTRDAAPHAVPDADRGLPLRALAALAAAAFITVLTEALPAGVLPAMSHDLRVSESATGQAVTVYAIGTAVAAIPLAAVTEGWRRKRLLLTGVAGFALANTGTALSENYALTMVARFLAGVAAGLVWALLAGYARRMVPAQLQGKAVAVVMTGIPVALSLGVPAGTFLGGALGWRATFTAMTVLALALAVWIGVTVPDFPGQRRGGRLPVLRTLAVPGVTPVLFVTLAVVLAHTVLYTYIAAYLQEFGMGGSVGLVLLLFGLASMVSIWFTGALVDRRLRTLCITGTALFAVAATALAASAGSPVLVHVAVTLWGLGFGGMPTLLQTAVADAGGDAADTGQAMLVTLWNAAMAGGGVAGGFLLDVAGPAYFPGVVLVLLAPVLVVVIAARRHAFPAGRVDASP